MKIFKPKNAVQEISFEQEIMSTEVNDESYLSFSTAFRDFGEDNLQLPRIFDQSVDKSTWVRFGYNNLFPQMVNQMYYTSPINGAIINFKTNATIGGGYLITPKSQETKDKVKALVFEKRHKLERLIEPITKDLIMHECTYFLLKFDGNDLKHVSRIPREKVRNSKDKSLYFISDDWSTHLNLTPIRPFKGLNREKEMILCFENECVGVDSYSIASYTSCLNWCELDGKMSLFHKNNIDNSIFPSFALMFPKKPSGDREKAELKKVIEGAKGAKNAGRIFALFANKPEQLPKIESIPTNQNDKLFEQTDERIDAQVCKAHCVDPLLLGIRVSGKLGSGNDIKQSYIIFEKNTVTPLRKKIEEIFTTILSIGGINAKFEINEFQIINEKIVEIENENEKIIDQISALPELMASEVIKRMSNEQLFKLIGLEK